MNSKVEWEFGLWKLLIPVGVVVLLVACAGTEKKRVRKAENSAIVTFFVATNGNDQWSGTMAFPSWWRRDGPFATLTRALEASREARMGGKSGAHVRIFLRDGSFFLNSPLVLKPEDSNLTIGAYKNGRPVISGGRAIGGWKKTMVEGKDLWAAQLPAAEKEWVFHELWVNGKRAVRARHPNRGYFAIAGLPDKTANWDQGQRRFRFSGEDLKALKSITNADVVAMTRWVESRLPVLNVDEKERIVTFGRRAVFELGPGDLYYVEGAFEFLDEPGEWYLDRERRIVYYLPRAGEKIEEVQAIAPVLAQVVRLEGKPEENQFVEKARFQSITFSHTEWNLPTGFAGGLGLPEKLPPQEIPPGGFGQAAVGVPAAVWGEGARDCVLQGCRFTQIGNYGLELARGCQGNLVGGCEFSDLGAGGLKIGEGVIREKMAEQTRGNEIRDCQICDGGKLFASAVGIWMGESPDNRIIHNHIHDFYYTGISIGWTWGYGASLATNNLVAFNHVHHIGVKSDGDGPILSDMGGIYTLGKEPGTKILNNKWHDIAGFRYGGWGIYFDEGSSGILAQSNIVYRTTHGGFHQHYGETNVLRNNIFAFARDQQLQRSRAEPHLSFSFETNIVYFDSGVLLSGDFSNDNFQMNWNVYFDARTTSTPTNFSVGPCSWEQWHERGHDRDSKISDPLFADPKHNDFRLRTNSPALKLGFQPIDLTRVAR